MAVELLGADFATTTVASGGYSSGASHLNVISTSTGTGLAPFPSSGNFRVTIFNQSTGAPEVILLVTAIASGTQFTTTAEVDGNASAGDIVVCTITSGGMAAILAQLNQTGTFSSLPTSAPFAGARYKCTDAPYEFVWNGSLWVPFYDGMEASLPPGSGWTADNLSANNAFATYANGYGYLVGQSSSNSNFCSMQYRSAPGSTPYSFVIRFVQDGSGLIQSVNAGGAGGFAVGAGASFGFRDNGGKFLTINFTTEGTDLVIYVLQWTSSTSLSGVATSFISSWQLVSLFSTGRGLWCKLRNDGTNLTFSISIEGNNWVELYTATITSFLANADNVTWGTFGKTQSAAVALYDWTQGT
jgi:hypothetical protein